MPVSASLLAAQRRYMQQQAMRAQMLQRSRGGQGQGGRGVQVGAVGQGRAAVQQQRSARGAQRVGFEEAKARYAAAAPPPQQGGDGGGGGFGGFLGGILDNPIVSNVLKPLQALSIPKNLIIAGAEEAVKHGPDWLGAVNLPLLLIDKEKADADKRGFWERVSDPEYGYGDIARQIDTGNDFVDTWANRGVGLAGDVALDPLTYLTAGSNKIPGATGRVALATEAEKLGLGEDVIRAAGRQGARGVRAVGDEAAVKALQLPEAGIRFAGERIPGTGRLGEGVEAALAGVRAPFTDTAFGKGVRRLGSARSPATRAAVESLVSGAETMTPSVAANEIGREWIKKAAAGEFTGALENSARHVAREGGNDPALTHALESGDVANLTPRQQKTVEVWRDTNRQVKERQLEAGVSVGELGDEALDWVPHIPTPEANEAFNHPTSGGFGAQRIGPESQQFSRVIKPGGEYTILGKTYTPITATIEEGNQWGLKNVGFKLYEDSPARLSAYAVQSASDAVGKVAGLKSLIGTGSQKLFGATDRRVTSIDKAATRAASRETGGELADRLAPLLADITSATERAGQTGRAVEAGQDLLSQFDKEALGAQQQAYRSAYADAGDAQQAYDLAARDVPDVSGQLAQLQPQLEAARGTEAGAQRSVDELRELAGSGLQGPQLTSPMVGPQMQNLGDQFQRLVAIAKAAPDEATQRQAILRAKVTQDQITDLTRRYALPVEGNALPEAAPLQESLERATGARQGLEEQLAPLQAQQAAHEAVGPPPDIEAMVSGQVQPRLDELNSARTTLTQHQTATEMSDLMAQSALGISEQRLQEEIAHLPEAAQAMVQVTMKADRSEPAMGKLLNDIRKGKLDDQVVLQANEGFELLRTDRLMGRDTIINSEMKRVMDESDEAMRQFNAVMHADKGLFGKVVDEYTKFFKSWATATPGFHLRNGLSATFMNMTEGVSFKEMLDGNTIWKTWRRYGGSSELARRASRRVAPDVEWVKYLPERLRTVAPDVVKAVYASGAGGRYTAAELGERAFGEAGEAGGRVGNLLRKTYENPALELSHNVGEHVEGRVRSGLALHALGPDNSGSFVDAVQRIKRVHFDYGDINEVDRKLRRVIPFWTFMSRNLPLQVQQMWVAPRAYSQYQSLMRNVNADPEGNMAMPDWLRRSGATFLNQGGLALNPDIGPAQVEASLGQIADPKSLLANLNPIYKTPLQLATGQNFFYGDQYKTNDFQKPGWESAIPSALLAQIGVGENTAQGVVQERKILDAIRDLIPITAQANRLTSSTADREGKGLAANLAYWGVPVRQVDQAKERKNQMNERRFAGYDEQDLRDALARFGGAA